MNSGSRAYTTPGDICPNHNGTIRCAIYTRKSTDEGLDQEFNSLDAQRESAESFIRSQQHEGWVCQPDAYNDGGFTGGNMERPALRCLISDIEKGDIDCVVVYKVDRLSRSLLDFSRIIGLFDKHGVSFVSVTQQFNTTSSMGRLTLNILLSFAQFSELNLDEYSAIPEGTGIVWEYSTDGGTTWDAIVPTEEENLPNIASDVLLRALFESTAINDSPALNYKDVNLIGHLNNTTGAYISRENELTQGVESTKVYTQMNIPSGTSLNWFTSNDDGATWEPMSIESTREIDQEWTEYTLTRTFSDPSGNEVRYKAEMTDNNLVFPRIHTLGATLS